MQGRKEDCTLSVGENIQLAKFTLRIKQLFLHFQLHIINDYGDCYKKEAKYDINKDKEYI